ncbi:hypothetical protein CsatB_029656 [Cannabis sativa]
MKRHSPSKFHLVAKVIVAIENSQDMIVQSARPYGQRAVLKFPQYTSAHAIAGRLMNELSCSCSRRSQRDGDLNPETGNEEPNTNAGGSTPMSEGAYDPTRYISLVDLENLQLR